MNTRKLLFYLLAVLLGSCVPVMSLHPLFTKEHLVFEEKLLGTWADDDRVFTGEIVLNRKKSKDRVPDNIGPRQ